MKRHEACGKLDAIDKEIICVQNINNSVTVLVFNVVYLQYKDINHDKVLNKQYLHHN